MTTRLNPPDLRKHKSCDLFKREVELWKVVTDLPKEKKGPNIALNLPDSSDYECDICSKVFEKLDFSKLE